jgi:hypothetical protein
MSVRIISHDRLAVVHLPEARPSNRSGDVQTLGARQRACGNPRGVSRNATSASLGNHSASSFAIELQGRSDSRLPRLNGFSMLGHHRSEACEDVPFVSCNRAKTHFRRNYLTGSGKFFKKFFSFFVGFEGCVCSSRDPQRGYRTSELVLDVLVTSALVLHAMNFRGPKTHHSALASVRPKAVVGRAGIAHPESRLSSFSAQVLPAVAPLR